MMASEATFIIHEADSAFVRFLEESRFWIQKVLLPTVSIVGLFGNIATILALTRREMRTSTNEYLKALAVADLIYLICVLWLSLRHYSFVNEDPFWSFTFSHVWPYTLYLADATKLLSSFVKLQDGMLNNFSPLNSLFSNTSVWLTVTFTMERCIAIAYPIKSIVLCTVSRAKRMVIAVYCICFTTTMPTLFEWTVKEITDSVTNASIFEIASSELGKLKMYQTIYYWFTSITFVMLPLVLLAIFNSFLIHSLRKAQKLRRILTARQTVPDHAKRAASREIKISSTLIAVVIMFIVCQLPTAATLIYKISRVTKLTANEEAVLRALGNIFNCLVALNAACNFILYCALSQKYRRTFMSTFFRCLCRPSSSVYLKTFDPRQVEGPNGIRFTSRRHSSSSSTRHNRNLVPFNVTASLNKSSDAWPRRMSTVPFPGQRKGDPITPSCIYDNGFSSDIFPQNNIVRSTIPSRHPYKKSSSITRSSAIVKKRSLDFPLLVSSSWPNIWTFNKSISASLKIPLQESNGTKDLPVTSCSV